MADHRLEALAKHLDISDEDVSQDGDMFEADGAEYLVLTDDDADEACKAYVLDSLWAFNTSFLRAHCKGIDSAETEKAVREMQEKLCESANGIIRSMIDDLPHFIEDAIKCDGRGHFLASYDSEELELKVNGLVKFFAYRVN